MYLVHIITSYYFNLVFNILIVSIWSLTSQRHVNLIHAVISLWKIANLINRENKKKLVYYHINES